MDCFSLQREEGSYGGILGNGGLVEEIDTLKAGGRAGEGGSRHKKPGWGGDRGRFLLVLYRGTVITGLT